MLYCQIQENGIFRCNSILNLKMIFYLIAADYKTASFEIREELYRQRRAIAAFWAALAPQQSAVFTTCNRIEIYAAAKNFSEARRQTSVFMKNFVGFCGNSRMVYAKENVFKHILRLACGLESQLQGELQIVEQLEAWLCKDSFAQNLRELAQRALNLSKEIRSRSGLDISRNNLATIVYSDIKKHVDNDGRYDIIILGTGKIAGLFAEFRPENARLYFAAHRNFSKAKLLAQAAGGEAVSLQEMDGLIAKTDVVISATKSPHFVLHLNLIARILLERNKPLYLYDLGIPRDIDPKIGSLRGVILKGLEGLRPLIEEYNSLIQDRLNLAEYLCGEAIKVHQEAAYA